MENLKGTTYSGLFQMQGEIFNNAFDKLSDKLALSRASDNSNHINWLLGHVLHCRFMLANMIGLQEVNPLGDQYFKAIEHKDYPGIDEIRQHWPQISEKLLNKISSMSNEDLDTRPAENKPSLSDIISFFIYHEAYHLGQIGIVRKIIGMEALKSN
ncbi:DinB family protein [Fulvivirgaceae bacterium BMA10]|uniref:DinB family protein n=1 Tax=Splendidivirga corallicola TaxID=3051826 RepID=A0ABT8KZ00_9BACT|nr:DinB family protein [Fulvivirgaceae bacterium BMA10]